MRYFVRNYHLLLVG